MTRLEKAVGDVTVIANCDHALEAHGRWLLDRLADADSFLKGAAVRVGWSRFTPKRDGNRIWVHEPDFELDPLRSTRNDISVSIGVLAQQIEVVRRVGVKPRDIFFAEAIQVQRGAFEDPDAVLERFETQNEAHSGWIAKPRGSDSGDLETIAVFELLRTRREWLQVLSLPPRYMVVFHRGEIEGILDQNDIDLWHEGIET